MQIKQVVILSDGSQALDATLPGLGAAWLADMR